MIFAGLVGLVIGLAGGLVWWEVETCPLECIGTQILAAFALPPTLMVTSALLLRLARTPRALLAGPLGVVAAIVVAVFLTRVTYSYVLICVIAGMVSFVWAALVVGPSLPAVARLAVFCSLFAVLPLTFAMDEVPARDKANVARLGRISVPLLAPDVPGLVVKHATADKDANELSIDLTRSRSGPRPFMADEITVTGTALPSDFHPPTSCGPPNRWSATSLPCTPDGPGLWHRTYLSRDQFLRVYGQWLYVVEGGSDVDAALVRQAATSLRPATARELVASR